jgi:cation diffusion facilitator family transporter
VSPLAQPATASRQERVHSPAVRRTLAVVLALNVVIVGVKIAVGVRTGALTVLGAALESGLDMLNNIIGMLLVTLAGRAPDEDHPYGHDKFETLGTLGIVGFLSISCFELLRGAISAAIGGVHPHRIVAADLGIMVFTLGLNVLVVWYERRQSHRLESAFLRVDAEHTQSDILVTLLALVSLGLSTVGWNAADPVLAIAVALLIARSGYHILRQSIPILVDQRAIPASDIRSVVSSIPSIADVRSVRSRFTASGKLFAELTIVIPGNTSVENAHALADKVEATIAREFGATAVTVHVEPA